MASQSDTARTVLHGLDFGLNAWVVEEQRQRFLRDPGSVEETWRDFFATPGVPAAAVSSPVAAAQDTSPTRPVGAVFAPDHEDTDEAALRAVRVAALIHAYRVRGHLAAGTDPLAAQPAAHPELDPAAFGLHGVDRAQDVVVDGFAGRAATTLDEVLGALREFYCGSVGFEYMHIQDSRERRWIQQRVESPQQRPDRARQLRILYRLGAAEAFETFLQTKYVGHKRYSLEGGESAVVLLDALLHSAIEDGVAEAVIGMAHRGRLNVLATSSASPTPRSSASSRTRWTPSPYRAQGT